MPLHLLKLCVGCDSIEDLRGSIERAMARRRAEGSPELYRHTTRMIPKRMEELLAGGSLYWVIRGSVLCRQELAAITPFVDDNGVSRCRLMLRPQIVPTVPQPRRPFQGWRYLRPEDAPADLSGSASEALPLQLRQELAALGLL
jgi:hypothetical protein